MHKAFFAYWILHVTGDLHQPLHCVSDYTTLLDPKTGLATGDNGGNGFALGTGRYKNLHSYWDAGITRATGPARSTARRAAKAEKANDLYSFGPELNDLEPSHWIAEGANLAKSDVYSGVEAGVDCPEAYGANADKVCLRQAALAGYRLAFLIQKLVGPKN